MTISNTIFQNDLARLAHSGEGQLVGRPSTDNDVLADDAFRREHGMSRADFAARARLWERERAEADITRDVDGDIPNNVDADVRGLSGGRREWARYCAWLHQTREQLAQLESVKAHLDRLIAAPTEMAETIAQSVTATAKRLVKGLAGDDEGAERDEMDRKLAAQRHKAQAAQEAMKDVDSRIGAKELQLKRLREREAEFLEPAIDEAFAASGARKIVERKRAELAAVEKAVKSFREGLPTYFGLTPAPM
jgi:hypothetical protein